MIKFEEAACGRMLFSSFDEPPTPHGPWSLSPIDFRNLAHTAEDLARMLIYFDDNPDATMDYISAQSSLMHHDGKCEMVIIDNLQSIKFITNESDLSRQDKVDLVIKRAKLLAENLKIPVILLSSLGRCMEKRLHDSRPGLIDLPWAQKIETYADIILLLYRPAQFDILSDDDGNSALGKGEIIIAKNRGKEVGKVQFKHNKGMSRIEDDNDDKPLL